MDASATIPRAEGGRSLSGSDEERRLRVALYVRVSTNKQEEAGTHESQIHELEERAVLEGWSHVLYPEPGVSGETLQARPIMRGLLDDVRAGQFDAVAVVALDRLCRSQNLDQWGAIANTLKEAGVQVIARGSVFDLSDPQQAFMFTILGPGVAGLEKEFIVRRFKAGKERAIRQRRKHMGLDPFGLAYDKETGAWSIVEEEAEVVRLIYALAEAGRSAGAIAARLAELGHRSRPTKKKPGGRPFSDSQVLRILRSRAYVGEYVYPKSGVTLTVPIIIDEATWKKVQVGLAGRRKGGSGRRSPAPFARRVVCGVHGTPMYRHTTQAKGEEGRTYSYYQCRTKRPKQAHERRGLACSTFPYDAVTEAAKASLHGLLDDPDLLEAACLLDADDSPVGMTWEAQIDRAAAEVDACKRQEAAVIDNAHILSPDVVSTKLGEIRERREGAQAAVEEGRQAVSRREEAREVARSLREQMAALRDRIEEMSDAEWQDLVRIVCPDPKRHGLFLMPDGNHVVRGALPLAKVAGAFVFVNPSRSSGRSD